MFLRGRRGNVRAISSRVHEATTQVWTCPKKTVSAQRQARSVLSQAESVDVRHVCLWFVSIRWVYSARAARGERGMDWASRTYSADREVGDILT